jgi:hypothetical protein
MNLQWFAYKCNEFIIKRLIRIKSHDVLEFKIVFINVGNFFKEIFNFTLTFNRFIQIFHIFNTLGKHGQNKMIQLISQINSK